MTSEELRKVFVGTIVVHPKSHRALVKKSDYSNGCGF
jgi:hypothetical protein